MKKIKDLKKEKGIDQLNVVRFETELRKLPKGKIPTCIKRYPMEFPDLQSPYKFFNEPSISAIKNGYEGYEARVKNVEYDDIYRPLVITGLEHIEDELTCIEIPTHINTNQKKYPTEQIALLYRYLEKKKDDKHYKGVFIRGDVEKTDPQDFDASKVDLRYIKANHKWRSTGKQYKDI